MALISKELANFSLLRDALRSSNSGLDFTIVNINIRSMRKYRDEFKHIAESASGLVDGFVITEINIPESCVSLFTLPNYRSHFVTRPCRRGGGIAIFVRDHFEVSYIAATFTHSESSAIRLANGVISMVLLAIYRPPSYSATRFLLELEETFRKFRAMNQLCLVGDVNINILCPVQPIVADYLGLLSSHDLECTVNVPTREEVVFDQLVTSCLDHIFIRAESFSFAFYVITKKLADHYFVVCRI